MAHYNDIELGNEMYYYLPEVGEYMKLGEKAKVIDNERGDEYEGILKADAPDFEGLEFETECGLNLIVSIAGYARYAAIPYKGHKLKSIQGGE